MPSDFAAFEAAANKGDFSSFAPEAEPEKPAQETSAAPEPETEQEATSAAESETAGEEQETTDKPKGKGGFQRRIDKLTAEKRQLEAKLAEASAATTPKPADEAKPAAPAGKPAIDQFDSYDAFMEALTDWKVEQKLAQVRQAEVQAKAQTEAAQLRSVVEKNIEAARERYEDYDDALESVSHIHVSPELQRAIFIDSDAKAELAYHLAKHPAELERIAALDPMRAALELGKIEAAIKPSPDKQKPAVKAPKPPATLGGKGATKEPEFGDDMPFREFEKRANKQFGGRSY